MNPKRLNLIGQKFYSLTVVGHFVENSIGMARAICECGAEVVTTSSHLKRGNKKSCGCKRAAWNRTHGQSRNSDTYKVWLGMRERCTNPNLRHFGRYGGRGITVCERWQSFENFLADMGARPRGKSIDRIDVNGNYEPSNCRWATAPEQARNRTDTTDVLKVLAIKTLAAAGWMNVDIARALSVTEVLVSSIRTDRTWRGVESSVSSP